MADYCWVYGVIHFASPAGLTACTPESAPGPTLGNEYGKTLPFNMADGRHLKNRKKRVAPTKNLHLCDAVFCQILCPHISLIKQY